MTLSRDEIAARILAGLMGKPVSYDPEGSARIACECADALIAELKRTAPQPEPADLTIDAAFAADKLSPKAYYALTRAGIKTLKEITERTPLDILCMKRIGKATLGNIKKCLAGYNLQLKEEAAQKGIEDKLDKEGMLFDRRVASEAR